MMFTYDKILSLFVAKTDKKDETKWLPLWMHLKDTVGVMRKLINRWVADSTIRGTGLSYDEFVKAACFLAAVHDIGKATSYFQHIITCKLPKKRLELNENGYVVNEVYCDAGKTPHAYAGEEILKQELSKYECYEADKISSYASVIGAHHGKPKENKIICGFSENYFRDYRINLYGTEDKADAILWHAVWENIIEAAYGESKVESFEELPKVNLEAQTIISGLLIMADWLASNSYYYPLINLYEHYKGDYQKRIDKGWGKLEFPDKWESETYCMDEEDFANRFGFMPNEVQKEFITIVNTVQKPGLFILEAPMGVGKTEASLAAVEMLANRCGASGIYFGLPTQATSNGLFPRLMEWAKEVSEDTINSVKLAHSSAEFNDEYRKYAFNGNAYLEEDSGENGLEIHPWFKGNKKALLADFVVGTVDQFLMATLKRRHFMLRHLGLSGKIVVIDECHAYDAYMNVYLENSLRWMAAYGIPVVLLSATLPKKRRMELVNAYSKGYVKCFLKDNPKNIVETDGWKESNKYPLYTWTDGLHVNQLSTEIKGESKKIRINYLDDKASMLITIKDKLSDGGCACIILNTVKEAQTVYDMANEILVDNRILLYHAQFIMSDRIKKEENLLNSMGKKSTEDDRSGVVLIGTQVLEQSLDYDADIMITQVCPIDLLLQRIGRLHRHKRNRPTKLKTPECILLTEGESKCLYDKGTERIYGEYLLERSLNALKEYKDIISVPRDISEIVQKVYDEEYSLGESSEAHNEYKSLLEGKKRRAQVFTLGKPNIRFKDNLDDKLNYENDGDSEAAVRDGLNTIEVILMRLRSDGTVGFIDEADDEVIYRNQIPDESVAMNIAKQKIKLPSVFCLRYTMSNTIKELEDMTRKEVAIWQQSPWLEGELVLLLDENRQTELNGYRICYSNEKGLEYEKL